MVKFRKTVHKDCDKIEIINSDLKLIEVKCSTTNVSNESEHRSIGSHYHGKELAAVSEASIKTLDLMDSRKSVPDDLGIKIVTVGKLGGLNIKENLGASNLSLFQPTLVGLDVVTHSGLSY